METFEIRNLSFTYPQGTKKALDGISLEIGKGDFAVLCGPSGCGKSTLLRHLKTVMAPHGRTEGEIYFEGTLLRELSSGDQSSKIGFVQQSPDNQIVTDKVWHELAFGLESLGYDTPSIRRRVAEMASFFGISDWFHKNIAELSGGQKQLLNLASIMTMQPKVLVLDEPTAQLDPIAASDFLAMLGKINRELGTTVVLTEHRLDEALILASKVFVLDDGRLLCQGNPRDVGLYLKSINSPMFYAMPAPMRIWASVKSDASCPLSVREGRDWLQSFGNDREFDELGEEAQHSYEPEPVLKVKEAWFRYEKDNPDIIKGLDLELRKGEFLAILGGNGAGKSTCLKLLAGLRKPYRGSIEVKGRTALLFQNPQVLFLKKSVEEDLYEVFDNTDIPAEEQKERVEQVISLCGLNSFRKRHPYDLSGGEQQRTALAKVLLLKPDILLLDEPTKGLDAEFKEILSLITEELTETGVSVIMVSHDIEFCAKYAHRCALFFDGGIVNSDSPRKFFAGNSFYTTASNRMAREFIPLAVTPEDVIGVIGGKLPPKPQLNFDVPKEPEDRDINPDQEEEVSVYSEKKKPLSSKAKAGTAVMLTLIPLTLLFGQFVLGGKQYTLISMLIVIECLIPFFIVFEGRKPQARELVTIAVLCALGVAGRMVFYMIPQFKPVMAIAIIAGATLGSETGFLVGSVSMLVSNMMFSQGPWAPWQMFAMGLIGFVAGVLVREGFISAKKSNMAIFGAFAALVIFGGIMNPASCFLALGGEGAITVQRIITYYISGLPMDVIQAVSTFIFLWVGAEPMMEKINRIKTKYGVIGA